MGKSEDKEREWAHAMLLIAFAWNRHDFSSTTLLWKKKMSSPDEIQRAGK